MTTANWLFLAERKIFNNFFNASEISSFTLEASESIYRPTEITQQKQKNLRFQG